MTIEMSAEIYLILLAIAMWLGYMSKRRLVVDRVEYRDKIVEKEKIVYRCEKYCIAKTAENLYSSLDMDDASYDDANVQMEVEKHRLEVMNHCFAKAAEIHAMPIANGTPKQTN